MWDIVSSVTTIAFKMPVVKYVRPQSLLCSTEPLATQVQDHVCLNVAQLKTVLLVPKSDMRGCVVVVLNLTMQALLSLDQVTRAMHVPLIHPGRAQHQLPLAAAWHGSAHRI